MKKLSITIAIVLLTGAFAVAQAQNNFSGSWKRNDVLSDAGHLSKNTIPVTIAIEQGASFIINMTMRNRKGEVSMDNDTLRFDNQPKTSINPQTKNQHISSVQWSDNKTHLLFKQSTVDPAGKVLQVWAYDISLTADGHLEVDVKLTDGESEYFLKEVFDKN